MSCWHILGLERGEVIDGGQCSATFDAIDSYGTLSYRCARFRMVQVVDGDGNVLAGVYDQ